MKSDFVLSSPFPVKTTFQNICNYFVDFGNQIRIIPNCQRYWVVCNILAAVKTEYFMIGNKRCGHCVRSRNTNCQVITTVLRQVFQTSINVTAYEKWVNWFLRILKWILSTGKTCEWMKNQDEEFAWKTHRRLFSHVFQYCGSPKKPVFHVNELSNCVHLIFANPSQQRFTKMSEWYSKEN